FRHVVNVAHVVLEIRDAPPEPDGLTEARRALTSECRAYGALRLHCLALLLGDVSRFRKTLNFGVERRECILQLVRRRLPANGDRSDVIERVVVHADLLPN